VPRRYSIRRERDRRAAGPARPVSRLVAALPDALTCLAYAWTWLQPLRFDADATKTLMLVMLMEFLCVHSGGFLGVTVLSRRLHARAEVARDPGPGLLLPDVRRGLQPGLPRLVAGVTFVWLLGSRFALVWLSPVPRKDEAGRQMSLWAVSVAAYLAGVFLGVLLPVPELGITAQVTAFARRWRAKACGWKSRRPSSPAAVFYFAAMAWSKWKWGAPI
jgi:hypothetical protein